LAEAVRDEYLTPWSADQAEQRFLDSFSALKV
jgi:hypothetical protein